MKLLFRTLYLTSVLLGLISTAQAQTVKTGVFTLDELEQGCSLNSPNAIYMPPNLSLDIEFIDDDGSGVLNAKENARIRLCIKNTGGDANGVKVFVQPVKNYRGLSYNNTEMIVNIPANRTLDVEFPINAGINLETSRNTKFAIKIYDPLGYDIETILNINTLEYMKSRLILNGVTSIDDEGVGLIARNGTPDGKVQTGDLVNVSIMLQNVGVGAASNVKYTITTKDPNVLLYTSTGPAQSITGSLDDIPSGKAEELSFRASPTNRYIHNGSFLPIYITLEEDEGFGNLTSQLIPIPFNAKYQKAEIRSIDADIDREIVKMWRSTIETKDSRVNLKYQQNRDNVRIPAIQERIKGVVVSVNADINRLRSPYEKVNIQ